jgi:uncharacterized protein YciI
MTSFFKTFFPAIIICLVATTTGCNEAEQSQLPSDSLQEQTEPLFNAELAEELGADNYGMRQYVMAFLKAGPNRELSETEAIEIQRAHLDNIRRMAENGDLVLAGPFMDRGEVRGIYIFNVTSIEEARALTESDPAIEAGSLEMELHPWYGSAALMKVNEIHATISKENP